MELVTALQTLRGEEEFARHKEWKFLLRVTPTSGIIKWNEQQKEEEGHGEIGSQNKIPVNIKRQREDGQCWKLDACHKILFAKNLQLSS